MQQSYDDTLAALLFQNYPAQSVVDNSAFPLSPYSSPSIPPSPSSLLVPVPNIEPQLKITVEGPSNTKFYYYKESGNRLPNETTLTGLQIPMKVSLLHYSSTHPLLLHVYSDSMDLRLHVAEQGETEGLYLNENICSFSIWFQKATLRQVGEKAPKKMNVREVAVHVECKELHMKESYIFHNLTGNYHNNKIPPVPKEGKYKKLKPSLSPLPIMETTLPAPVIPLEARMAEVYCRSILFYVIEHFSNKFQRILIALPPRGKAISIRFHKMRMIQEFQFTTLAPSVDITLFTNSQGNIAIDFPTNIEGFSEAEQITFEERCKELIEAFTYQGLVKLVSWDNLQNELQLV